MVVLVINSGSSSLKFGLLDTDKEKALCKGLVERIGLSDSRFTYTPSGGEKTKTTLSVETHRDAIAAAIEAITHPDHGVIDDMNAIDAVGHRIVHGGEEIQSSCALTPEVERLIEEASPMAPLHNPANLMGVRAVRELLSEVPHVGVFDTAFHAQMPPVSYRIPINEEIYSRHGIRRFGFHGTSHQYVATRTAELLGKPLDALNCIICHLGNGSSLTAVRKGRSVDTSLGFGTMCGVPMGTRAGDVDPAVILHLIQVVGMSPHEVSELLYKGSGMKGISGLTNDMRDIEDAAQEGDEKAQLALDLFTTGVRKYIGAYATHMDGALDAIVFTAGIGENGPEARESICKGLEVLGAELDPKRNSGLRGQEAVLSKDSSQVALLVVPTNEELLIAKETHRLAHRR